MFVGPILGRELLTSPRRPSHFIIRSAYVGVLFVLMVTVWQLFVGFQKFVRLGDYAYFSGVVFAAFAYAQLAMILFVASLYGASAVSHEKDRRTFVLLLVTRLFDSEIVIEKFLCGMLQVGMLLVVSIPVFLAIVLMGGVGFGQIVGALAVMLGATLFSCAIGVLIAIWREKTYQAVSMTILAIVLALLGVEVWGAVAGDGDFLGHPVSFWTACLSPFRAVWTVIDPDAGITAGSELIRSACWIYLGIAAMGAVLFLGIAILRMRAWNPRGEPLQQRETAEDAGLTQAQIDEKIFRKVWSNPVLWREVRTRAYGTRNIILKVAYMLVFAILGWWMITTNPSPQDPKLVLILSQSLLPLSIISLLLVNTQAVTAITSERDLKSLDLLLVTDITPKEFIYGKIFGILFNTAEMVLAPLALLILAACLGLTGAENLVFSVVTLLVFVLFSVVLGIHAGMRYDSTRLAIAHSLGTTFLLSVGILTCLLLILMAPHYEEQFMSFVLFIVLGSIGLWISLRANAPSNAITLTAATAPAMTFYSVIAVIVGDRGAPFLVTTLVYGFAIVALLIPLLSEFDVATGRTTVEGS